MRRRGRALWLGAVLGLLLGTPAQGATWDTVGHGSGHGVGLSQWGAHGYALQGRGHRRILGHYYRGTEIGQAGGATVKVLLDAGPASVRFTRATSACGRELRPDRDYRFARGTGEVVLRREGGERLKRCGTAGTASGTSGIRIRGHGPYRGKLRAVVRDAGGLLVVNVVGLEGYLRGVIASEMPSSWPAAALRAQAVAARSYALATSMEGPFDVFDDTRSQVYGGKGAETPATDAAVADTAGQVVRYGGQVATTYFFSSSGGRTESVEYGFPGAAPSPYLNSVDDPYDGGPSHRWVVTFSQAEMESRLAGLFSGRLRRIRVLERGDSPRIVRARVVGSESGSKVSGQVLRDRLGLLSTWARFEKR